MFVKAAPEAKREFKLPSRLSVEMLDDWVFAGSSLGREILVLRAGSLLAQSPSTPLIRNISAGLRSDALHDTDAGCLGPLLELWREGAPWTQQRRMIV